ncbi:MAG: type IV toxin-antitoxin system AbiEi family antitoxin domain-containing protein [Pirellulaceae bacterium]
MDWRRSSRVGGLSTLSPRRMQRLLKECRSIKVKRLLMWFGERHGFRWLNQIRRDDIYLGKGKRMLVRGGTLGPKYLITVPKDMDSGHPCLARSGVGVHPHRSRSDTIRQPTDGWSGRADCWRR